MQIPYCTNIDLFSSFLGSLLGLISTVIAVLWRNLVITTYEGKVKNSWSSQQPMWPWGIDRSVGTRTGADVTATLG